MNTFLSTMTDWQLIRLNNHVWDRMTRYNGYQPFGYDAVTLWLTKPGWMRHLEAIHAELRKRGYGDGR